MKKIREVFSSKPLSVEIPKNWKELSVKQLRLVCNLFAAELFQDSFDFILFFRLAGISLVEYDSSDAFIVKKGDEFYRVSSSCGFAIADAVAWVHEVPDIRDIEPIGKLIHKSALQMALEKATLAEFIAADSLYFGYISTNNQDIADDLIRILCPKIKKIKSWHRPAAVLWFSALKKYLADRFNFLYSQSDPNDIFKSNTASPTAIRDSADAMIRALTKGDITLEERVLESNLYRALTELNQLAKEYQELKKL